jgi:voltage-gated potassium channel Kch
MEYGVRILRELIGWLLSPTRQIIDLWKRGDPSHQGYALRSWNSWLFWIEIVASIALVLLFARAPVTEANLSSGALIVYAWSRINEIAYAFYRDALSRTKSSDLTVTDRIRMAMRSYFGLAVNFAILYYFSPVANLFNNSFGNFLEAFYFSGVTLATLGYGDILPQHWLSRLLALYEVFTGILIVAVAIATYVGGLGKDDAELPKQ